MKAIPEAGLAGAGSFFQRLLFLEATELARRGAYASAEGVLRDWPVGEAPPEVLDLLARICAQQGRWPEAAQHWRQALRQRPQQPEFVAGLARLDRLQQSSHLPALARFLLPLLAGLLALGILAVALKIVNRQISGEHRLLEQELARQLQNQALSNRHEIQQLTTLLRSTPAPPASASPMPDLVRLRSGLSGIEDALAAQSQKQEASAAGHAALIAALAGASNDLRFLRQRVDEIAQRPAPSAVVVSDPTPARIPVAPPVAPPSIPGIATHARSDLLVIEFEEGLFDLGTRLVRGAGARLDSLSRWLATEAGRVQVEIIGMADDDRLFGTWTPQWESALALERASFVAARFLKNGSVRPENLSISAGHSVDSARSGPFRERIRRRTVVLQIRHLAEMNPQVQ